MSVQIALLDYGMGNRRSVHKALEHVGASVAMTDDPRILRSSAGIVIPGPIESAAFCVPFIAYS